MMLGRRYCLLLALVLATALGCGRQTALSVDKDFEIEALEYKEWEIDPPKKDQKVNVLLRTAGGKLDVYVATAEEYRTLKPQLDKQEKVTAKTLGKQNQIGEGQLEATVPAG